MNKRPYQDVWRNGHLVQAGRRECSERYGAIARVLSGAFGRGFTVADVGGWDGYFAVRLAEELDAKATNIDSRRIDLPCHRRMKVTADNVLTIGEQDAILCLSVLHHMEDWRAVYAGLKAQAKVLLVEVCHPDEAKGQLSPVMKLTAHRIAEQYAVVSGDATQTIVETPCLDRPSVRRPTFLIHGDRWGAERSILGVAEAGSGRASKLMGELEPEEWGALGYVPCLGTLNVAVAPADADWLKSQPGVKAPGLGRSTHYVPVSVEGIPCHVHFARSPRGRAEKVIELVSAVKLLDALGIANGDRVEIKA